MNQKRLLVDISQILKANLHVAESRDTATSVEHDGKLVKIPDAHEGYELFLISYLKTLRFLKMTPNQTVLVKDGYNAKAMRREYLPGYSVRVKGPNEWMEQFEKALQLVEDTVLSYGGISLW